MNETGVKPWYKSKTLMMLLPLVVLPLLEAGQHLIKANPLLVTLLAGLAAWARLVSVDVIGSAPPPTSTDAAGFQIDPEDKP